MDFASCRFDMSFVDPSRKPLGFVLVPAFVLPRSNMAKRNQTIPEVFVLIASSSFQGNSCPWPEEVFPLPFSSRFLFESAEKPFDFVQIEVFPPVQTPFHDHSHHRVPSDCKNHQFSEIQNPDGTLRFISFVEERRG